MNKATIIIAIAALAGCAATVTEVEPTKSGTEKLDNNATTGTPVAFKNDKGELLCPVMGSVIASEDKAVSFQDHAGKRYYFCCDGCPENFKNDPAKYEDGKAVPKSGTM